MLQLLSILLVTVAISEGFVVRPSLSNPAFTSRPTSGSASGCDGSLYMSGGGIERLEFTIHPDGRIEETVKGIKGQNCHSVTDEINQHLGEVVASSPTEEMYENEVVIDQTVTDSVSDGGDGASDGWGGGSW